MHSLQIQELWHTFGDIPHYTPLEGGTGINYLFCVNATKQAIADVCKKHNYTINRDDLTEVEIDDSMYNSMHRASLSYSGPSDYVLRKLE